MKTTTINRIKITALLTTLLLGISSTGRAASSSWAVDANGSWSDASKWAGSVIADQAGAVATFDVAITAVRTTTLDSDRTLGGLVFGKSSGYIGTVQSWTVNGSSLLTLDNSGIVPTVTCWPLRSAGNSAVNMQARLLGSLGLKKLGGGTLWLQANNLGLTGDLIIAEGRVFNNNALGIGDMSVIISNGCYLSFYTGGSYLYNNITLNGIGKTQDGQLKAAIYADNNTVAVTLGGTIVLNSTSDIGTSGNVSAGTSGSVTLTGTITGLGGLVKNGTANTFGPLVLAAGTVADYTGPTWVSNGVFAVDTILSASPVTNFSNSILAGNGGYVQTSALILSNAVVAPGRTNVAGTLSINELTCGAGARLVFDLDPSSFAEGSGVNDLLLVTNLTLNGPVTNVINFTTTTTPAVGRYVLARYSGVATGLTNWTLPLAFKLLPIHPGLDLSVPGEVALVISNSATLDVTWAGDGVGNVWDLNQTANWQDTVNLTATKFADGQTVRFTDSGNNTIPVSLNGALAPGQLLVGANIDFEFTGTGKLTGGGLLTKSGAGTLTLSNGANDYSGNTILSGGVLRLGKDEVLPDGASAGNVIVNGATLDLNGHKEALTGLQGSGVVDNTSPQPSTLTVYSTVPSGGTGNAFSGLLANSGGPLTLIKTGPGMMQWPVTGANTTTGGTVVNDGRYMVRNLTAMGYGNVTISNNAILFFFQALPGPVTNDFYLYSVGNIQEGQLFETVASASTATNTLTGTIHLVDTANLGASGFSGAAVNELRVQGKITGSGALQKASMDSTNAFGTLALGNPANDFTGGFDIFEGRVRLDASEVIPDGPGKGNVSIVNGWINTPYVFEETVLNMNGQTETINGLSGDGVVTNSSATAATLVLGNNNTTSEFNGAIGGNVNLQKIGTGKWSFNGNSVSLGTLTVASGTLGGNGAFIGPVVIQSGATLAAGAATIGTLTINNSLSLNGNVIARIDKSLSQSNDLVVVTGPLNNGGTGTLTVNNLGPALAVGDKFTLFSQPLLAGNSLTIAAPAGVTFTNRLAIDGSIQVLTTSGTTSPNPTNMTYTVAGNALTLAWPVDHLGWYAQSNSVNVADINSWHDIPGSQLVTNLTITINPAMPKGFYRLRHP